MDTHGLHIIIHGGGGRVGSGGVKRMIFFNVRWALPRQLGGALGSIKDHLKHDSCRFLENILTFVGDQSGIIWDSFGINLLELGVF